jgi:prolyl oligopeptidase
VRYPDARRLDVVDDLRGHRVPDPYRWLEDAASGETVAWSQAQDELWRAFAATLPGRDRLAARLRELTPGHLSAPAVRGERMFFSRRLPDQDLATYCVREPDGTERVLVDPLELDPGGTTTLENAGVSMDGALLGYVVSEAGTEQSVLRVIDTTSGELVEGPLELGRGGNFTWLRGGDRYAVVRRIDDVPAGEEQLHRRVWVHRLGTPLADDLMLFGEGRDPRTYYGLSAAPTSDHLLVGAWIGTEPRNDLYLFDLAGDDLTPVVVQEGVDAESWGDIRAGRVYLRTDLDAPKGRICVADLDRPAVEEWEELIAETEEVLDGFVVTDEHVVTTRMRDVVSVVAVHERATGAPVKEVDLPGLGVASVTAPPLGGNRVWITYTDHLSPPRVLLHDLGDRSTVPWADPPGAVEVAGIEVQQVFAISADSTRVPMFVLSPVGRQGPLPTIVVGYGGFNVTAYPPAYSPQAIAWLEAGGVFAYTSLRGGSEYGEEWHRAGMRENKQNVFDDLFACSQWLVDNGYTTPDQLGISGGSNGGLLVGAALTQRPHLYRSVVCSAPLLDMVRYEQFGLGATWNDEYGRADDPTELEWLLSYSPYHRVTEGTEYPAVLFTVFENDTRVDPLHARKMCAALQAATSAAPADRPVLYRRETDVGHGGRSVSRGIELSADTLAFHASQLGLALRP